MYVLCTASASQVHDKTLGRSYAATPVLLFSGVTLINGAELKQLIKEYLDKDVIPGTSPPKRLRASANVQTGRPGPTQP
jgi:hypothetical protein